MHENIARSPSFLQLNSVRQGLIANAMAHNAPNMASHVTTNVHLSLQWMIHSLATSQEVIQSEM